MGSSSYSDSAYHAARTYRSVHRVSDFAYTDSGAASSAGKVHDDLNVHGKVRESRDSDAHPVSRPVAVWTDVTGSMATVPRLIFNDLPTLFGLLQRKGYLEHPHVLFAAVGDWTCDRAPIQVGQFEGGNEVENDLSKFWLEGGGGGQATESYELLLWFMAHRTVTDAWKKRGEKGFLFVIGDEMAYPKADARAVQDLFGVTLEADVPLRDVLAAAQEKWEIYYIMPSGASHSGERRILDFWRDLLGQNVIELADLSALCSTIALTVGLAAGATDLDSGLDDLADAGVSDTDRAVVGRALATVGSAAAPGAVVTAAPPGDLDAPGGNTRI